MNKKFLQMMIFTAFAFIGLIGSGNCDSPLEECAKNCWINNDPKGMCGIHESAGKANWKCAKSFCECWNACEKAR